MLSTYPGGQEALATALNRELNDALVDEDVVATQRSLLRITGLLVAADPMRNERALLHAVCFSPVRCFKAEIVQLSVTCWQWLLSARPNLSLQVSNCSLFSRR